MLGEFASQDEWNGGVLDVAVEGNVASVADGFAGFHLLSVSDPTHPVRLGRGQRCLAFESNRYV